MKTSSLVLIPATQFGTANGNYDGTSLTFTSEPVKAAGYYTKDGSLQTASWFLNNIVGILTFEATLDEDPLSDNYFSVTPVIGDANIAVTENNSLNIIGTYTWIRVVVNEFTSGAITKVSLGY